MTGNWRKVVNFGREILFHGQRAATAGKGIGGFFFDLARRGEAVEIIVLIEVFDHNGSGRFRLGLHAGEPAPHALRRLVAGHGAGQNEANRAADHEQCQGQQNAEGEAERRGSGGHHQIEP